MGKKADTANSQSPTLPAGRSSVGSGKATLGGGIQLFDYGDLPTGWVFEMLGNRCAIRRGSSPRPAGDPRYFGGGTIPWIKIGDATKTSGRYIESTEEFVNEEGAKRSVRIPAGSLIIANSGVSLGFAAITRVEGCIHDGWLLPTDFDRLDRDYLYYCITWSRCVYAASRMALPSPT